MSRCLAVCCDGTWNKADSPRRTNVRLTYEALFPAVRAYYDEGVGTHWYDRIRGGVVGTGLGANVEQAYRWLCETYERWDSIYLFGFSRGAYTARSVAGIVGLCGIQKNPGQVDAAIAVYRMSPGPDRDQKAKVMRLGRSTTVRFLGVWDTVGSLGVPTLTSWRHRWHDVTLGPHVQHAVHALALDEHRRPFAPTTWTQTSRKGQIVRQAWFPGVHGDVGGGRGDRGLSDRALLWMWEAANYAGLSSRWIDRPTLAPIEECSIGDTLTGLYRLMGGINRPIGTGITGECVHVSALQLAGTARGAAFKDLPVVGAEHS